MFNQRRFREAVALHQSGHLEKAAQKYDALLALHPDAPDLLHLSGVLKGQTGDPEEAIRLIGHAIALQPNVAEYYQNLAVSYETVGNDEAAALNYSEMGMRLLEQRRNEEALAAYERALSLVPYNISLAINRATVLNLLGRYEEADTIIHDLLPRLVEQPDSLVKFLDQGNAWFGLGEFGRALAAFDRALDLSPDMPLLHWNCALILLQQGKYKRGWQEYEWRWKWSGFNEPRRGFTKPLWRGETAAELAGPLLVLGEQGFGDNIQFSRYLPVLADQGHDVIFEVKDELVHLFRQSFLGKKIRVVSRQEPPATHENLAYAAYIGLLSLPERLGTTIETIPAETPYLHVDPVRVEAWWHRLAGSNLKVGLAWNGSPHHPRASERSIPLETLAILLDKPGIDFYALQKEATGALPPKLIDLGPQLYDFTDTAAAAVTLDLIISIDTAIVHLAGALNCPVWVMLTQHADWRWGEEGETSPWYPSLKLFRQPKRGDWDSVVIEIANALDNFHPDRK